MPFTHSDPPSPSMVSATAPAKTILFGEHAVVYGEPAIAVPLHELRTSAKLLSEAAPSEFTLDAPDIGVKSALSEMDQEHPLRHLIEIIQTFFAIAPLPKATLRVESAIPIAAGLGSGASVSVAIIRAFAAYLHQPIANQDVSALSFEIEKIYHGNPSGIDNTVISFGVPMLFQKEKPFIPLRVEKTPILIIADTQLKSSTAAVVRSVRERHSENQAPMRQIGRISLEAADMLQKGNFPRLGQLMNENQALLRKIGVSCEKLDSLIQTALDAGALGAKITGAGWGGNMIAIADNPRSAAEIRAALSKAGGKVLL